MCIRDSIYTPRVDIVSVSLDESKEEIAKIFLDTGFSRLPVYEENIDHIIGIINQKDFHNFIYNTDRSIKEIVRPVLFITPTMKIGSLLKKLQASKTHIATVSYTHLDVYKRQVLPLPVPWCAIRKS